MNVVTSGVNDCSNTHRHVAPHTKIERDAGNEFHCSILLHHCHVKNKTIVISRKQLQGDIDEAVGGSLFGPISGAELVLGMPSEALSAMPVHDLCCVLRIAQKAKVLDF
jgi:hypothetical protein